MIIKSLTLSVLLEHFVSDKRFLLFFLSSPSEMEETSLLFNGSSDSPEDDDDDPKSKEWILSDGDGKPPSIQKMTNRAIGRNFRYLPSLLSLLFPSLTLLTYEKKTLCTRISMAGIGIFNQTSSLVEVFCVGVAYFVDHRHHRFSISLLFHGQSAGKVDPTDLQH